MEIQHQTFAPLCENMVCKGRPDHRQAPKRLICRQAYRDRPLRLVNHTRMPANKKRVDWFATLYAHGTSRSCRLITWSVFTVVNAHMLHRMVWHWPHDQHNEYVVRIDVQHQQKIAMYGKPKIVVSQ